MRLEELSLFKAMIEDGEAGRFDNVRAAVEDTLGGYYRCAADPRAPRPPAPPGPRARAARPSGPRRGRGRDRAIARKTHARARRGVLPMVGTFTEGRALPVKSARTPIKTLRMALLPGWYVLYGKHPAALRDVDPEDEADVDGLESCRWKTASGNQSRDVWNVGVEKKYYDAAESHLLQGKFRARGTVFSRIEDEASRLWRAGGAIIMVLVVSRREARLKVDAKDAPAAGTPAPWAPPAFGGPAYAPGAAAYAPPGAAAYAPPGAAAAYAPPGAAAAYAPPPPAAAAYAPEAYAPPPPADDGGPAAKRARAAGGGGDDSDEDPSARALDAPPPQMPPALTCNLEGGDRGATAA